MHRPLRNRQIRGCQLPGDPHPRKGGTLLPRCTNHRPASSQAPYPSLPRRARKLIHSAAPPLKIAIALLDCDFVLCMSVQRGLFLPRRTHTRCRGRKPHTAATRASRRRTVPAVEGCKDANRSRRYPLALLLRQTPEPLIGAALRKNAEISLCNFQRPL